MSQVQDPPAGWTASYFKAVCVDVGSWTWGTVQGAFNEKASLSQIIVDAVIGMIPLVGDATAVRDLIAVVIGMVDDEEKRNSTWQWVFLIVLLFALIPVIGGVIKGAGRIILKIALEAEHLTPAMKIGHNADGANEIIDFLNRIGQKNAQKWMLALRIADHKTMLLEKFGYLMGTLDKTLAAAGSRLGDSFPSLTTRIKTLRGGIADVRKKGTEMIPIAVKELDQKLREIQAYIRSGGETASRVTLHEVATGQRVTTLTQERRLIEQGALPARSTRGGFRQNPANHRDPGEIAKYYTHVPGYPDMKYGGPDAKTGQFNSIAAFAGKMVNRQLNDGEQIFRFFGPARTTHGVPVDAASASGGWWGVGRAPRTAKEWREYAAVLDSFNGDGFYVTAKVKGYNGPKAVVGTVSEQFGNKIPGQYLPGGATQAFFFLEKSFADALRKMGEDFINGVDPGPVIDATTGLEFTFHKTGWIDANGIWGYSRDLGVPATQTARLASREKAAKDNNKVIIRP
ncbi:hypothetical protein [Pseudoduganella buxea]|uniref:Uncharacterized protein n=1 Tax=Pseudoduganella buxea TaxID=1949069 RepID=A0A6I3T4H7_9BURK|nr:hypothetical protein [Pseudoduganella buxea]MTV56353.1 hypothetical protein [Pseudoduganella buxea]GGC25394.1 hypothetical protein GCM10011572_53490 [Pseudoduganella buxea]